MSDKDNPDLTIPLLDYHSKRHLIVNHLTNIIKSDSSCSKELVNYLFTCIQNPHQSRIITYIDQNTVWVMPSLWRAVKTTKQHAYDVVNKLILYGRVNITLYTLNKPAKNMKGRNPHIYKLSDIKLNGINDPLVKEARIKYYEAFNRYDMGVPIKSSGGLLDSISQLLVDYYILAKRFGPDHSPSERELIGKVKSDHPQVPPEMRLPIAQIAKRELHQYKEGSP